MNAVIKNFLAVILGWLSGSIINMGLIQIGYIFFPLNDVDVNDMYALAEVMPTLDNEYFIFLFLAHALGTLAGATVAAFIAANHKIKFALAIGGLFLLGGIMVNYMLPGPKWFTILDSIAAYLPMSWLGGKIALKFSNIN